MTPTTAAGVVAARTTPADSMATSVPAPMAMPTSARASAGASLTPSPTIATVSAALPAARRPCWSLSSGSTSAKTSSTPRSRDRLGDLPGVTGDHDHARRRARAARRPPGVTPAGPRPRGRARRSPAPSARREHGAAPRSAMPSVVLGELGRDRPSVRSRSRAGPPTATVCAVDGGPDAAAGQRRGSRSPRDMAPRSLARPRRWPGPAGARCRPRPPRPGAAARPRRAVDGGDAGHDVRAVGQGAGLVEQDGVDGAHPLQRQAVLDQDAGAAAIDVEIAMTSGMARPRACGQAITSTVTVR